LGICTGHILIGNFFGAKISSFDFSIQAFRDEKIQIESCDNIFYGVKRHIMTKQMHVDSVTLPKSFNLLGSSKICKNQIMKHKSKPIYTC